MLNRRAQLVVLVHALVSAGFTLAAPASRVREESAPTSEPQRTATTGVEQDSLHWLLAGGGESAASEAAPAAPVELPAAHEESIRLPETPSSFALVLSAMASFGAYQGLRSLKRLSFQLPVPDWYHEDAGQVGHVVPFELGGTLPAERLFEPRPLAPSPLSTYLALRILCPPGVRAELAVIPRGPPIG